MFARWQAILSAFDFDIEFIKGESNSLPDFLTRKFLQGKSDKILFYRKSNELVQEQLQRQRQRD